MTMITIKDKTVPYLFFLFLIIATPKNEANELKNVYFGDTHLHTYYSFDAFLNNNHSIGPDAAYRWAKGQPVIHPFNRTRVQINTPLDFLVVADHAEMLGVMKSIRDDNFLGDDLGIIGNLKRWYAFRSMNQAVDDGTGLAFFRQFVPQNPKFEGHPDPVKLPGNNISDLAIFGDIRMTIERTWLDIVDSADKHNEPEKFTALIGWEWSSVPMGVNLHRVVVSPHGGDIAKSYLPFGSDQSQYPQDLWEWLEDTRNKTGAEFLAIPHNSNISKGYMFDRTTLEGDQITTSYAETRLAWEPIVEVTQIKGDSETHSKLSPNDDFADFENYEYYIQVGKTEFMPREADFIRPALKAGLEIEKSVGVNPYKFGLIGSTDSHLDPFRRKLSTIARSGGNKPVLESTRKRTKSASANAINDCSSVSASIPSSIPVSPPVSMTTNFLPRRVPSPYFLSLVNPARSATRASLDFVKRLNRVDLPTLGLPTKAITGIIFQIQNI